MANIPTRNNNPGDLKDPQTGNIRQFNNPLEGKAALYNDLTAKMTGTSSTGLNGESSLVDFSKIYAPASDNNNPLQYAANIANQLGVSPDTKIGTLIPRIDEFASAIGKNEGYQGDSIKFNPKPFSSGIVEFPTKLEQSSQEKNDNQSLSSELLNRTNQLGGAIQKTASKEINPISGLIQGVGAVAGGINDVVNKGLELIPGVKQIENLIGQGVGSLANSSVGQPIVNAIKDFAKNHPELSDDIGAGFNILTAIPIFKGLSLAKNVALDAIGTALRGVAEKGALKDLSSAFARTKTLSNTLAKNGGENTIKDGIARGLIPDIEGGKYATRNVISQTGDVISNIDKTELQPILEEISKKQSIGQNLGTLKKLAIDEAKADVDLKESGLVPQAIKQIEKRFNGWKYSYGDNIDLGTENRLKIGSGKFTDWDTPEGSADKAIYSALQKNIEDIARKNGFENLISTVNQKMSALIKYQKLLKALHGSPVKVGKVRGFLQHAAGTMAGGYIGGKLGGIPGEIAGGYIGNKAAGLLEKKSVGGLLGSTLKRAK